MIGTHILKLSVMVMAFCLDALLFKWNALPVRVMNLIHRPTPPTVQAPISAPKRVRKPTAAPTHVRPASLFPKVVERKYVPTPVVLGRKYVEFDLERGDIRTPPAPETKPQVLKLAGV